MKLWGERGMAFACLVGGLYEMGNSLEVMENVVFRG